MDLNRARMAAVGVVMVAAVALWAAPAAAGGGGEGGVCYEEQTQPSDGWVAVADSCFTPADLAIEAGETVRWELRSTPGSHTVTFPSGPDSGPLNDTFAVTFNAPGSYPYSCVYHPGMDGTINVEGAAIPGPALEVLGGTGSTLQTFEALPQPVGAIEPAGEQMIISFDPLAASVILLLGLPFSLAAALRLAGFAGPARPQGFRGTSQPVPGPERKRRR